MLIIVKEKSDINVRMMSKAQAEQGATAADVIGTRKPDPKDWEIKYAPADTPEAAPNSKQFLMNYQNSQT